MPQTQNIGLMVWTGLFREISDYFSFIFGLN